MSFEPQGTTERLAFCLGVIRDVHLDDKKLSVAQSAFLEIDYECRSISEAEHCLKEAGFEAFEAAMLALIFWNFRNRDRLPIFAKSIRGAIGIFKRFHCNNEKLLAAVRNFQETTYEEQTLQVAARCLENAGFVGDGVGLIAILLWYIKDSMWNILPKPEGCPL